MSAYVALSDIEIDGTATGQTGGCGWAERLGHTIQRGAKRPASLDSASGAGGDRQNRHLSTKHEQALFSHYRQTCLRKHPFESFSFLESL